MKAIGRAALLAGLSLFSFGCDESDLTSIKITLKADGSGTIRVNCVAIPEATTIEQSSPGAMWSNRVQLTTTIGSFDAIEALAVAGISFQMPPATAKVGYLVVSLPRGPEAAWPEAIAPVSEAQRADAAAALDETGKLAVLGKKIKIEIDLPGEVSATGAFPYLPKVAPSKKKTIATLAVPVEIGREDGEAITWNIAWQKPEEAGTTPAP